MQKLELTVASEGKGLHRQILDSSPAPRLHKHAVRFHFRVATSEDREEIYRLRHDVYARELGQHSPTSVGRLTDSLDDFNTYLVAVADGKVIGFVSVTPPDGGTFSIDKYFTRAQLPFEIDERVFEVRLLTVSSAYRGRPVAALLMYAAFRWVEDKGGNRIIALGRQQIVAMYRKAGLLPTGLRTQSGSVSYEVLHASLEELQSHVATMTAVILRLGREVNWDLPMPLRKPASCFHGGAFFEAIGDDFSDLARRHRIISADVLDAWFPPSPRVTQSLRDELPWLLQTSPPADSRGLVQAIAGARGVGRENVLPGAGSSSLIFLAFREWLRPDSRVLILDPTYGEYAHVLEEVIGCRVDRFRLEREDNFQIDVSKLGDQLCRGYNLVALVNPNSPTGQFLRSEQMEMLFQRCPSQTRIWIDETYLDYVDRTQSIEQLAAESHRIFVCKSMSKVYGLSGVRVAYLCGPEREIERLRAWTPPWAVSLPAQLAAVRALEDPGYYAARYQETHELRKQLARQLTGLGWEVTPGSANFLLCHLPEDGMTAGELVKCARREGLYLRDASRTSEVLGRQAVRVAVKDAETNARMLQILRRISMV